MHHLRGDGQDVPQRLLGCVRPLVKIILVVRSLRVLITLVNHSSGSTDGAGDGKGTAAGADTPMRGACGDRERAPRTSSELPAVSMAFLI